MCPTGIAQIDIACKLVSALLHCILHLNDGIVAGNFWLGMTQHADGQWRWDTTGEVVSWNQWDTFHYWTQPQAGGGACAVVWAGSNPTNLWHNNPCHNAWLPMCEHEPWN